ncbi:MAG: extracellular solute-binding protein, partial [Clostridia bacterium]|nr:extracellular solute-binding protein [Clostridia bacterium]
PNIDIPEDQLYEFEMAVKPIPQLDPENPKMISQGPSICVFNKRDPGEVVASWLFAQFLLTNDVQIEYSTTEGYVPVTTRAQQSDEYLDYLSRRGEELTLLGGTLDLHAGQVVDRTGVALGLPFPAGPHLEQLAVKGQAKALLPVNMADGDLYCHFSGAESQVQRWIRAGAMPKEDIAREVYDLLARTVSRLVCAGAAKTGIRQVLIAGGVASSPLFRELVRARIAKRDRQLHVCFGKPEYSGDNAVGTALIGAQKLREMEQQQE